MPARGSVFALCKGGIIVVKNGQKISTITMSIFFCVLLICGGFILGIQQEQNEVTKRLHAEEVKKIAVVNLDEGIKEGDKQIYYADRLMNLKNGDLVIDNLEAAREGIVNGIYAGYVIVPADFSKDTASLNTNPKKTILSYALNPNLREDVSVLTLTAIRDFEMTLNTSMSYMYVQAILNEFHNVQDSADVIMTNDNQDLSNLESIDSKKLLTSIDYKPLVKVDNNIEQLDLSGEYSDNEDVVGNIGDINKKFSKDVTAAFDNIKKDESLVTSQMNTLNSTFSSIDISKDDSGNIVYKPGQDKIDLNLDTYNSDFDLIKESLNTKMGLYPEKQSPPTIVVQDQVDKRLLEISGSLASSVDAYNESLPNKQEMLDDLNALKLSSSISEESDEAKKIDNLISKVDSIAELNLSISEEKIDVTSNLNTIFDGLMTDINILPKIKTDDIQKVFDEEMVKPLTDEVLSETNKVNTQTGNTTTILGNYVKRLSEFNPYQYYDSKAVDDQIGKFSSNVSRIEEKSSKTHTDYLNYVDDVYQATDKNVTDLQNGIDMAYQGTTSNVDSRISQAKKERSSINEINISLLEEFSNKLPYTRLGELEYTQAYDFIANPVLTKDISQITRNISISYNVQILIKIYIIFTVIWLVAFLFLAIRRKILSRGQMKEA